MRASDPSPFRTQTLTPVPTAPRPRNLKNVILLWGAAFGSFPAGFVLDKWITGAAALHAVIPFGCFLGYLYFARKALKIRYPELDRRWQRGEGTLRIGFVAFACLASANAATSQQTIFNIPSADVLDSGKEYFEEDTLWRPSDPRFALFAARGVAGLGGHVEAGINVGGFATPGRSVPTATLALKWQPFQAGAFALTAGANGLFFLRGARDGLPALQGYAHASYRLPTQTRLTAGGWFASSGYAAEDPAHGALLGLEQPITPNLALIADMYTGRSALGYTTYGIEPSFGPWTLYAGYSVKNGDSKANAILLEIGFTH